MDSSRQRAVRPRNSSSGGGGALSIISRHATKKRVSIGLVWLFGLFAVFFAPAPVKITEEKLANFRRSIAQAHKVEDRLAAAERSYLEADMRARRHKVWFWRFRPEYREKVKAHDPEIRDAKTRVRALQQERDAMLKEAKSNLGIWSDAGIEESRKMLWTSFDSGKVFAQRQTFWDSLFTILRARDRDWVSLLVNLLLTALVNYTVGGIMAVVTFIFSLPSFISSYATSFPSGLLFFAVASVAAASLIAAYLALLYFSGAAVIYTTASFVNMQQRRLAYERQQRLRYGGRPHYE
ncbi:hypothetical protein M9435_005394 [Picochlorum sp. BPE23]|nr:hypothetical protein M9435_005394 [Picochlorum sp. BPE23]